MALQDINGFSGVHRFLRRRVLSSVERGMTEYGFEKFIDRRYMVDTLVKLLKEDCSVSLGPETLMEPDHPKLVHYVQHVIRPELQDIGVYDIFDMPKNQLAVRMGAGKRNVGLLIMAYTPVQHFNWMDDPFSGKIAIPEEYGIDEPCAFGQGASQSLDGVPAELVYGRGAYDAGGPTSMGIPTVMWGRPSIGTSLMGDDFVTLRGVEEEAKILGRLIMDMLG
jgi:acetylornithine deacetylase/succinyl-diaminopimelate desuccinylase-like protein